MEQRSQCLNKAASISLKPLELKDGVVRRHLLKEGDKVKWKKGQNPWTRFQEAAGEEGIETQLEGLCSK